MVTIRLDGDKNPVCDDLKNFDFALDSEKDEVEVYRNNQLLGYYRGIIGASEEELLDYIKNCYEQESNKVQ